MQTQLPFMDDDDAQGEDTDTLHVAEQEKDTVDLGSLAFLNLGIPVEQQRVLLVWVTRSVTAELHAVACMPDGEIRQCFRNFLYRTMSTLSVEELRAG
jgi:hypothetical protein